jgi:starch-binding outer membrane protein, SusD/RagB family
MSMKKIFSILIVSSIVFASCKKQLDVKNPNEPTPEASTTEQGITSLAQGGIYINGFKNLKYGDGVFGLYWSGAMGFHEMLGDVVGVEAANAFCNQIGTPDKVTLSAANGSAVLLNPNNPNKWYSFLRTVNQNDQQGSNFIYYEWAYMYNMISACNKILALIPDVTFTGNTATKSATLKAWCHFWKGYAYARIGSIYYAGIINNVSGATNANYVTKEAIITESNAQFDLAIADLGAATSTADYTAVIEKLIPSFCQTGRGFAPTTAMWIRNINTLKARNILVNKTVSAMTASDWNNILTLTNSGVLASDYIFTGRTTATGDFIPATSGFVAAKVQSSAAGGNTYKLSERWVQEFKTGDLRKANNCKQSVNPWIGNSDRGNAFNTRFTLYNGGNNISGTYVYVNTATGAFELPLAGTYEENALMKAEAQIYLGSIDAGLTQIDNVRTFMGAGLAAVSGTGLTADQAKEELRRERRVALAFRGLSFYDSRRWKVSEPASGGGGRTGCVVITTAGVIDTNSTIDYGYLDYWDVPDNELAYNPPASGSAVVKNPK